MEKLTEKQMKIVQIVAGIVTAGIIWVSIWVSRFADDISNDLGKFVVQYLFIIIFVIVMFGQRFIENKYQIRIKHFRIALIVGLAIGIVVYLILALVSGAL